MTLKELYKHYGRAAFTPYGCILQSNEKKRQPVDDEWSVIDFEYLVYDKKEKDVVFKSYSYSKCCEVLREIEKKYTK